MYAGDFHSKLFVSLIISFNSKLSRICKKIILILLHDEKIIVTFVSEKAFEYEHY